MSLMNPSLDFTKVSEDEANEVINEARGLYLVVLFLSGSDVNIFGGLVETLEN